MGPAETRLSRQQGSRRLEEAKGDLKESHDCGEYSLPSWETCTLLGATRRGRSQDLSCTNHCHPLTISRCNLEHSDVSQTRSPVDGLHPPLIKPAETEAWEENLGSGVGWAWGFPIPLSLSSRVMQMPSHLGWHTSREGEERAC